MMRTSGAEVVEEDLGSCDVVVTSQTEADMTAETKRMLQQLSLPIVNPKWSDTHTHTHEETQRE